MSHDSQVSGDYVGHCGGPPTLSLPALSFNLKKKKEESVSDSVELTLPFVTRFVLCVSSQAESDEAARKHRGTCRCGARTDTEMRCNLW